MDNLQLPEIKKNGENSSLLDKAFLECLPMNNPGIVAVIHADDYKILFINWQFEYYIGYSGMDLSGEGVFFTGLLEDYKTDHFKNQLNTVDENIHARSSYVIYNLKKKSGEKAPFYLYASPFVYGDNRYGKLYFILMHPDLSKWGMPFTSFDSKELFLEQFNSEDFGTFEWIMDVDKVFWSEGLYRIYEVDKKRHEINNLYAMTFVHAADKTRVKESIGYAITSETDLNIEFKIVTAKNNIKIIHCIARTVKNSEGTPTKFVGSIRDITKQRAIEADLENKVEELYHSNKELEEFAYVASHDMQEPLRKITTFSDLLSEKYRDVLDRDAALYISRIVASAESMRNLINNLLEFSRISKTEQPFGPVNLNVILREVKSDLELIIDETKTSIQNALLPTVEAIASQMKQLFTNIISNAIKFHKPGIDPEISVESIAISEDEIVSHELDKETTYYKIAVVDNGIGFENEYATRIFQVFQRLHGKADYPGSGIGLAICKKILEYHHGIIYAESNPGSGTRFVFILPQYQPKSLTPTP